MIVDIETRRLRTIGHRPLAVGLRAFVEGNEAVDFQPQTRDEAYGYSPEARQGSASPTATPRRRACSRPRAPVRAPCKPRRRARVAFALDPPPTPCATPPPRFPDTSPTTLDRGQTTLEHPRHRQMDIQRGPLHGSARFTLTISLDNGECQARGASAFGRQWLCYIAPPFAPPAWRTLPPCARANRLDGRVVMQRTATPCTPVRFRLQPPLPPVSLSRECLRKLLKNKVIYWKQRDRSMVWGRTAKVARLCTGLAETLPG